MAPIIITSKIYRIFEVYINPTKYKLLHRLSKYVISHEGCTCNFGLKVIILNVLNRFNRFIKFIINVKSIYFFIFYINVYNRLLKNHMYIAFGLSYVLSVFIRILASISAFVHYVLNILIFLGNFFDPLHFSSMQFSKLYNNKGVLCIRFLQLEFIRHMRVPKESQRLN